MHRSLIQAATFTRIDRRFVLGLLVALSAFDCGGTASDINSSGSAGASQAGSSAAGTSGASPGGAGGSSGSVTSGGTAHTAGAGGAGGNAGAVSNAGAADRAIAGGGGAAGGGSGQACGDQTCDANQYCRAPCSGTGLAGSQSLGPPSCAALPAACNGVPTCECICGSFTFFCTPGAFQVQCGCA